jgi:hypothetical protein
MWTSRTEELGDRAGQRIELLTSGTRLTFADVLASWQNDRDFRSFFTALLARAAYSAYRWETPPVTRSTTKRAFEFVLLDCPGLDRMPDANAFASYFHGSAPSDSVVTFSNLGKDAVLVVPKPATKATAYGHLAAFVRAAPEEQQHELWAAVSNAMQSRINDQPVWLSTAGMGVSWLHVRLDDRPKYYGHRPYTQS